LRLDKFIFIAILISILLHAAFFAVSPFISLPGFQDVYDNTRKIFRLEDVVGEVADVNLFEEVLPKADTVKVSHKGPLFEDKDFEDMFLEENAPKDFSLEVKKDDLRQFGIDNLFAEHDKDIASDFIRRKEVEKATKDADPDRRSLSEKPFDASRVSYEVVTTETSLSSGQPIKQEYVRPIVEKENTEFLRTSDKADDLMDKVAVKRSGTRLGEYEDVTEKLDVEVVTFNDPVSAEKYFKITISVKEGKHFNVMPKEVIFLIDSSKSVTEDKLEFLKKSIIESLGEHNSLDRVNVVAFRGNIIKFKDAPVRISDGIINKIKSFISQLHAIGQTDVEKALLGIIAEKILLYPSYIVLITDGRPTTGMLDSQKIIQEITRQNNMIRPIFCFGGGRKVNKYLLDFISFQNRGWSHFSETTSDIIREFKAFYKQIKDPILIDVRYRITGLDAEGVYPKYLSDFYQGRSFVIYGNFKDEDIFSMQILGQINGQLKEFIFKRSLKNASVGTSEIAREWAFMKTYYLISQNTMGLGDKEKQSEEILGLSQRYQIKTPYDIIDEGDFDN